MTTSNVKCTCTHPVQDGLYGPGMRATTPTRTGQLRCTVCGALHGSQSMTTAAAKVKASRESGAAVTPAKKEPEKKASKGKKESKDKKGEKPDKKKRSQKGGKR